MPARNLILGFFDPSVTLGQLLQSLITAAAAIWVGHAISRRHLDERSVRELLVRCCTDAGIALVALSDAVEAAAWPDQDRPLEASTRTTLFRKFQIYSNHIAIVSTGLKQSCERQPSLTPVLINVGPLKNAADDLLERISEPLVRDRSLTAEEIRGIHGSVFKNRELLVQMQLHIVYPPRP
jgi:hypothetical protein